MANAEVSSKSIKRSQVKKFRRFFIKILNKLDEKNIKRSLLVCLKFPNLMMTFYRNDVLYQGVFTMAFLPRRF